MVSSALHSRHALELTERGATGKARLLLRAVLKS
jgi:hypothetical protein